MMLAEFIAHALCHEAENRELYEYIEHSVQWFDTVPDRFSNFHLVFLLKLARFLGIAPNMEEYSDGNFFDLTYGHFTSSGMPSATTMDSNDTQLLFRLSETSYSSMNNIAMNRHDRARMIHYIATYYSLHIPRFPDMQSIEILQTLFDE